jgi:hypothetical protein
MRYEISAARPVEHEPMSPKTRRRIRIAVMAAAIFFLFIFIGIKVDSNETHRQIAAGHQAALEREAEKEKIAKAIANKRVRIGMTAAQCESAWGKPQRVNRTINAHGRTEQWVYAGGYLYLDNGILRSIQN